MVEDDADLVFLMRSALEKSGHVCRDAASLADGRVLVSSEGFDCLLLDLVLPDGNGMDLLAAVASGRNRGVAVIVVSGNVEAHMLEDPRIKACFQKPYDLRSLLRCVEAVA